LSLERTKYTSVSLVSTVSPGFRPFLALGDP
jgi:hypothetical protein